MYSDFEEYLRAAVGLGRKAAEELAEQNDPSTYPELEPDATGVYTDTEVMLKITGQKSLPDKEEQETILGVFRDSFYEALEEL